MLFKKRPRFFTKSKLFSQQFLPINKNLIKLLFIISLSLIIFTSCAPTSEKQQWKKGFLSCNTSLSTHQRDKSLVEPFSLAGEWQFKLDPQNLGTEEEWFKTILDDNIKLPGSCEENS